MLKSLQYRPKFVLSQHSLLLYPIGVSNNSLQRTNYAPKSPIFHSSISLSHKTHIQKPIICAKKNKRKSGSQRLTKFILNSITIIASNLKILPQPFDLVIGEFSGGGGGGGGGLGFLKGFGGGGFDGWRRKGKKNLGFLGFMVVCGLALYFGRELKSDVFWWVLGFGLFGVVFVKEWKRGVKDLVLGLCWFGVLVILGLRREEVQKLVERFMVCCSPVLEIVRKRRRNGRSAF